MFEDTKKIKRALKRKEKGKAKSAEKWKDRLEKVETHKNAKQDKRERNLAIRSGKASKEDEAADEAGVDGGKKKRGRFDESRAKAPRVGFEGKKTTFLNSKASKSD